MEARWAGSNPTWATETLRKWRITNDGAGRHERSLETLETQFEDLIRYCQGNQVDPKELIRRIKEYMYLHKHVYPTLK
jgi:hypothetical protein